MVLLLYPYGICIYTKRTPLENLFFQNTKFSAEYTGKHKFFHFHSVSFPKEGILLYAFQSSGSTCLKSPRKHGMYLFK